MNTLVDKIISTVEKVKNKEIAHFIVCGLIDSNNAICQQDWHHLDEIFMQISRALDPDVALVVIEDVWCMDKTGSAKRQYNNWLKETLEEFPTYGGDSGEHLH